MKANLLEALTQVQDFRAPRGRRYPLWLLLLLVIMGTMSGCLGYRALEDFVNVVSVFNTRCGVAVALQQFHNKETSEIAVVQALLASLKLQSVVFTFDSLHCQKKLLS